MSGRGVGFVRLPIVRRTSGAKADFRLLTRLRLPSPSVDLHFRWYLYGCLLSLDIIILRLKLHTLKLAYVSVKNSYSFQIRY